MSDLAWRDYIHDAALAVGAFQRAFLPKHPRDWHYGMDVYMRGISTRGLNIGGEEKHVRIDLHAGVVRLDDIAWSLEEYSAKGILDNLKVWLESHKIKAEVETPKFSGGRWDHGQAKAYLEALWWMDLQLKAIKAGLAGGVTQPVLLFPHHFDLSLVWFPWDDERQLGMGWSTGDETIHEPYVYLTAYPEPKGFTALPLPEGAYWQKEGFSGAILPYAALQSSSQPDKLLQNFAAGLFKAARLLLAE